MEAHCLSDTVALTADVEASRDSEGTSTKQLIWVAVGIIVPSFLIMYSSRNPSVGMEACPGWNVAQTAHDEAWRLVEEYL